MSDKGYIKFALVMGVVVGTITGIPLVSATQYCCCMPLVFCSAGSVSGYLHLNKGASMASGDAALAGLVTGVVGVIVYFLLSFSISLLFMFFSPETFRAMQVPGMELEKFGFATLSTGVVFLYTTILSAIYGFFFLILGPLSSVGALHLFHKERISNG